MKHVDGIPCLAALLRCGIARTLTDWLNPKGMSADTEDYEAFEKFISKELAAAHVILRDEDAEYLARFVEEDMELDDKREGFVSMVGGFLIEADAPLPANVEELFTRISEEWEMRKARSLEDDGPLSEGEDDGEVLTIKNILSTLTPEELAAAQKAAILRQFAYVDQEDEPSSAQYGDGSNHQNIGALASKEEKAADERRKLIEQALKLDSKKKKYRKQQEVDLLAPNLNAAKVAYAAQMQREAARSQAKDKKERDRAALEKQRADIAKAKADKQKKAAKVERRA